tara:strand:- start:691 stop:1773 length:1083 start_codon:yes stop_codon:yes gene_type:complete
MTSIFDFLSRESRQARRRALDEAVGDFMTSITPPNLRPTVEFVGQANPLQGMSDSMAASEIVFDPEQTAEARKRAALDMGLEMALALTPAALAARGYLTPVQGVMEGLLGGFKTQKSQTPNAAKNASQLSVASDVAERGNQILNMLKSGRANDITDSMFDMGNPSKNTQLNQYLFENYDLPMDTASRMARANEMGFDVNNISYHGTKEANLERFDPEFIKQGLGGKVLYSTDIPKIASGYAGSDMPFGTPSGSGILPLLLRGNRKAMPAADLAKGKNLYFENVQKNIQTAKDEGFAGMNLQTTDPTGAKVQTTFDLSDVRSKFARFDPRIQNLTNLTAGILAAIGSGDFITELKKQEQIQ